MTSGQTRSGEGATRPPLSAGNRSDLGNREALPVITGTRVWPVLRFITRLPAFALLGLIRIYQRTLSPVLPAVFGSACGCRFAPTCSHYAAEAIRTHGALAGTVLAAVRLLKCSPLHSGGFDPVPPRRSRRMCVRSAPVSFPTSPASRLSSP